MEQVYLISLDGKRLGIARANPAVGPLAWFHENKPAYSMDHAVQHEGYSVEEAEPDCGDVAALLEGIAERLGITADFEFVPFSRSRNVGMESGTGEPWPSLNWRVTLKRGSRTILTTDYGQGTAYAPAHDAKPRGGNVGLSDRYAESLRKRAIDAEIETGRIHEFGESAFMRDGIRDTRKPVPAPRLGDVLESLALDSRVLDEGTFEQWAEGLGYSTDSRKAEAIWKLCVAHATALRAGLGARAVEELQLAAEFN